MNKTLFAPLALILVAVLGLSGCGQLSGSGAVAVLDLQRVLADSGLLAQVEREMTAAGQRGQSELSKVQNQLDTQLKKVKDSLGDKPSKEDQAKFEAQLGQANQHFQKNRQQVAQTLQNMRNRLMGQAQQRALAATREVTKANGIKVVLLRGAVFDYQPDVDITDSVLARMGKGQTGGAGQQAAAPQQAAQPESKK